MADVQELTMNSPIGDIHGLGKKTLAVFTTAGYTTVGHLYNSTTSDLQDRLTEAIALLQTDNAGQVVSFFCCLDMLYAWHHFNSLTCCAGLDGSTKALLEHCC